MKEVSSGIKVYKEESHFINKNSEIKELYNRVKEKILDLDDNIEIMPKKNYIGFFITNRFVSIKIRKNHLKFSIFVKDNLLDPKKIANSMQKISHFSIIRIAKNCFCLLNYRTNS